MARLGREGSSVLGITAFAAVVLKTRSPPCRHSGGLGRRCFPMRPRSRLFLLPVLAVTVIAGLLMSPSGVRAASGKAASPIRGASWALGSAPGSVTVSNVLYHGGPVMAGQMQVYAIFWEPAGSVVSSKFNMLIKRYFRDVGDSGLYANNGQYTDSIGQAPAGAELAARLWIARPTRPPRCSRIPISGTRSCAR